MYICDFNISTPRSLVFDIKKQKSINIGVLKLTIMSHKLPKPIKLSRGLKGGKLKKKNSKIRFSITSFYPTHIHSLWNIYFIRKEFLYTKLKYSRTQSYDIVSGGSAILFAGLIGFLTTEKFGFELVDSGDFYIFGMYFVLFIFSIRLFLKTRFTNEGFFEQSILFHYWNYLKSIYFIFKTFIWRF